VYIAEHKLWLAILHLLWSFTTCALPNEPICLDKYNGHSGQTPLHFRVKLVPRYDKVYLIVEEEDEITL
jgi:hypothetical protein